MSRVRQWLLNAGVAVASALVALGLAEAAVRTLAPQPTGLSLQDRFGLALHYPGITRYLPQFGHSVAFNSAGMRDREHPIAKPAGTYRVLLLGDSFMEAFQVPFEASMPSLLERGLAGDDAPEIEVINAGVSGWGTDDELRYLASYGLRYRPDLLLVAVTLHNDLSDNLRQEWYRLDGDSLVLRYREPLSPARYAILRAKAWVATRFQIYQLWRRVRRGREMRQVARSLNSHLVELFEEPSPPVIARAARLTGLLLSRAKAVADSSGARLAVVLLPIRYQLSDSSFAEFERRTGLPKGRLRLENPQRLVTAAADSLGIAVIDLLPPFREWTAAGAGPLFLEWEGHWNEAGHRLAAEVVSRQLRDRGLVPSGP